MDVVDLAPEHEPLYHMCLEDWSNEIREAGAETCLAKPIGTQDLLAALELHA